MPGSDPDLAHSTEAIRQALAERPEGSGRSSTSIHVFRGIPRAWRRFEIPFRYHAPRYEITVENPSGVTRGISAVEVDGTPLGSGRASLPLIDDGATRRVRGLLG